MAHNENDHMYGSRKQYESGATALPTCRPCRSSPSTSMWTAVYESGGVYYSAGRPVACTQLLGAPIRKVNDVQDYV